MTFWDFCSPIYDIAQRHNDGSFEKVIEDIKTIVPQNSHVLELAAGTGEISINIADKTSEVVCTDLSKNMLAIAKRKSTRANLQNIKFQTADIYNLDFVDNSFDVVIASQVLHLLDEPEKAVAEMRRVSNGVVLTPVCLLKNIKGFTKIKVGLWRAFGFAPKNEFDAVSYKEFLTKLGLQPTEYKTYESKMPYAMGIWREI